MKKQRRQKNKDKLERNKQNQSLMKKERKIEENYVKKQRKPK